MIKLTRKEHYFLLVALLFVLIAFGIYTFSSIKIFKTKFTLINFVRKGDNIKEIDGLEQINRFLQQENRPYYLISIFNSVCMNCPSGYLIEKMKDLYKINGKVHFLMILPENFTDNDLDNLRTNLGIGFPIKRMDKKLSEKLNKFKNKERITLFPYIVFITDRTGKVIDVMNTKYDKKFLDLVEKLCMEPRNGN